MARLGGFVPRDGAAWQRLAGGMLGIVLATHLCASEVAAQDCTPLLSMFQAGRSTAEIAQITGLTTNEVDFCHQQLRRPVFIGPAGAPPVGAPGPAPRNAAGPPPSGNAVGPPPVGAAGPPPVGRDIRRLP